MYLLIWKFRPRYLPCKNISVFLSGLGRLNITSGTRTYRIPSPTRPHFISRNTFQQPTQEQQESSSAAEISSLDNDPTNQKGFYISFDNEQPKRPKPPLRTKKSSPKKERSNPDTPEEGSYESQENLVSYKAFYFKLKSFSSRWESNTRV